MTNKGKWYIKFRNEFFIKEVVAVIRFHLFPTVEFFWENVRNYNGFNIYLEKNFFIRLSFLTFSVQLGYHWDYFSEFDNHKGRN